MTLEDIDAARSPAELRERTAAVSALAGARRAGILAGAVERVAGIDREIEALSAAVERDDVLSDEIKARLDRITSQPRPRFPSTPLHEGSP